MTDEQIIFIGDSLTQGYNSTDQRFPQGVCFASLLAQEYPAVRSFNLGISGQRLEDFPFTQTPHCFVWRARSSVVFFNEVYNSIVAGDTPAQVAQNNRDLGTQLKGWGHKPIVWTLPTDPENANYTNILAANALMLADFPTVVDGPLRIGGSWATALVDIASLSVSLPDTIHPDDAGHVTVKNGLLPALQMLL